ncbi:MAG: class I SAM-dependent methyltransferase [Candidatus Pacebacteria bacterium]|nr:class I SAM-dependent methyltransferase [Candidatus Paceibacterota bacterium]
MRKEYRLPKTIPNDMGGIGETLDSRMTQVFEILNEAPIEKLQTFLDIGMGQGQLLKRLSKEGKTCTGIGLQIETYGEEMKNLKKLGINVIEGDAEKLPFPDKSFGGVVMCHTLEHCFNTGIVLKETKRVLKDDGWFFVFVPPYDSKICSGHVNTGWNIGQLMYVLLLNGFDVKNGRFIKYGYNIAAFVQKEKRELPPLRFDRGDISILAENDFWPAKIHSAKKDSDSFYGDIVSVNWNPDSNLLQKHRQTFIGKTIKLIPKRVRLMLGYRFSLCSKMIKNGLLEESNNLVNPKILKG